MNQKENSTVIVMLVALLVLVVAVIALLLGGIFKDSKFMGQPLKLGEKTEETRKVTNFSKIKLNNCGNIILEQSVDEFLKIEAGEGIMEYISTEVKNDTLVINYDWRYVSQICNDLFTDINYFIKVKELSGLTISGSGNIEAGEIKANDVEFKIEGSGKIKMSIESEKIATKIEGSGKLELEGEVQEQIVDIDGSGKYLAKNLISEDTKISISGSGMVEVNAEENLDVKISGSGSVYYLGKPSINQSVSGNGKIKQLK